MYFIINKVQFEKRKSKRKTSSRKLSKPTSTTTTAPIPTKTIEHIELSKRQSCRRTEEREPNRFEAGKQRTENPLQVERNRTSAALRAGKKPTETDRRAQ